MDVTRDTATTAASRASGTVATAAMLTVCPRTRGDRRHRVAQRNVRAERPRGASRSLIWDGANAVRPKLEAQLASIEAEIQKAEGAIDRYLHAFEAGTLPEAQCGERLRALAQKLAELRNRRDDLGHELSDAGNSDELPDFGTVRRDLATLLAVEAASGHQEGTPPDPHRGRARGEPRAHPADLPGAPEVGITHGGRNRDRTYDLCDVNAALVPTELCAPGPPSASVIAIDDTSASARPRMARLRPRRRAGFSCRLLAGRPRGR